MWLSLILLFLVVGITLRQAMQGLFSALIMMILSICCATAALGTYEWVAIHLLAKYWKPDYAMPVALGLTFGVPLSIFFGVFARLIRRSGLVAAWVDRLGGGVCGFVTALILVGVLALCLQMLPFDRGSILGYARINVPDPMDPVDPNALGSDEEHELFLKPDRFVVGLASVLSAGTFSGDRSFFDHNPDLVQTIGWVGATNPMVSRYAPPGSISVMGTAIIPEVFKSTRADERRGIQEEFTPEAPGSGHEFRAIRVRLRDDARDERKSHIFTLRQFRLVGRRPGHNIDEQYHAIAIAEDDDSGQGTHFVREHKRGGAFVPVVNAVYSPGGTSNKVDVVFEVPTGFVPSFLEYKRAARAAVPLREGGMAQDDMRSSPTEPQRTSAARPPSQRRGAEPTGGSTRRSRGSRGTRATRSGNGQPNAGRGQGDSGRRRGNTGRARRRGGNIRGVASNEGGSKFSDELPLTLQSYRRLQNVDISNGRIASGHILAVLDEQSGGNGPPVSKFFVPEDKRLLQLQATRLHARSGLGRAISFAATTLQNYFVQDTRGKRYVLAGKYATATVGGQKIFEVQYYSGPVGKIGGLGKFNRIDEQKLTPKDEFVLLFLVEPGAHITSFSTGGSATRADDLAAENLIAPK